MEFVRELLSPGDIIAALIAGYALFRTVVVKRHEASLKKQEAELQAKLKAQADEREFRQQAAGREQQFEQLQRSWERDAVTELLHQDQEFIRETIVTNLNNLDKRLRILEETTAQSRDTLANVWHIANEVKQELARFKQEIILALKKILMQAFSK